ncbi:MAG: lysophospholipase [Roseobacter sp.]|nr:lysophospholipase [Roseobacter sp.]
MRRFGRWLGRGLLGAVALGALLYVFGPYEPVDTDVSFDARQLDGGVGAYFARVESAYGDITEGVEKRVIWAGEAEARSPLALLYIHGFSATSEEIRPVPDRVAQALGANLVYTRLTGHGRGGAAMAEARAGDWMRDTAEALAVARAVGEEVIVISTSTGGTLVALAMLDPAMREGVRGAVFLSPNFGINDPMAWALTLPAARGFVPLVIGAERSWGAVNALQEKYWSTRYPSVAVLPMAALVKEAVARDYSGVGVPALFHYAQEDQVVDAKATAQLAARWGGAVHSVVLAPEAEVEDSRHVLAGDIVSPKQTEAAVEMILSWIKGL